MSAADSPSSSPGVGTAGLNPAARPDLSTHLLIKLKHYAQLIRLPNVFTALADICLGALAGGALPGRWLSFALLLCSSACLYSAGMVWNDYFDYEQDYRERPFRPLPSGKVSRRAAVVLGVALLAAGILFAALAGIEGNSFRTLPLTLSFFLIVCILFYDSWLKRTSMGPVAMGACRFLNVLLGLSAAETWIGGWGVHLALVVGLYIVGVTWFARTEARTSKRSALTGAAYVMFASLVLALPLPGWFDVEQRPWSVVLFPYLLVGLGFLVGIPIYRAIAEPGPAQVQAAVKRAIMGLVVLDAVLATGGAGAAGLLILLLLLPALYLGRWIYST
jgi:4-hydroxybenzoate polyprenyltransferase